MQATLNVILFLFQWIAFLLIFNRSENWEITKGELEGNNELWDAII